MSPTTGRRYPVALICRAFGVARSSLYASTARSSVGPALPLGKRGPKTAIDTKKALGPARLDRETVRAVQGAMKSEGKAVTTTQLCRWFGVPRRTLYYRAKQRRIALDEAKVAKVKAVIEEQPTYGYRRIAFELEENRKVIQRIQQRKGGRCANGRRGTDHE